MATTDVDICNKALALVRANEIGSLDEASVQANKCRFLYPEARDHVLSMAPWPFCKAIIAGALLTETPAEWKYAYALPERCLNVRYILASSDSGMIEAYQGVDNRFGSIDLDPVEFEVGLSALDTRAVLTNQVDARVCYTKRIDDVRVYGQLVTDLIAYRLAMDLATPLGGDNGSKYFSRAERMYMTLKTQAEAIHNNQRQPRYKQQLPRSIAGRLGRSAFRRG